VVVKKYDHSRGLCGKPDVQKNTPRDEVEKNSARCLCCGSKMEIHDPTSVTMQQLGSYALVCPKCPKKAE